MAEEAVAYVSVVAQSKGIGAGIAAEIGNAGDTGGKLAANGIVARFAGIATKVTALGAGIGSAFILKAGWDRLTDIEDATASMTVSLGSATKAGKLLDKVMDVVTGTPFSYSNFASAASNLAGFGVQATKIPGILTAIADASASKGSQAQAFADRLGTSFGQMAARGVVGMDQINSLSDVGVNGLAILGNAFGVSTDEMAKMISNGAVPAAQAIDILTSGIENGSQGADGATTSFAGMGKALGETTAGKVANLQTAFANLGASAIKPLIPTITELVGKLTSFLKDAAVPVGNAMKNLGNFVKNNIPLILTLAGVIAGLVAVYATWKVVSTAIAVATDIAAAAQWALNLAMDANPIGIIVLAIAALVAGLIWFFTQTKLGKEIWANVSAFFISTWQAIADFFVALWNGIVAVVTTVWTWIVTFITTYITTVQTIITTVVNAIVAVWNTVWGAISSFFVAVWNGIVGFVTTYINVVMSIIQAVGATISSIWNGIWNGIVSFFTGAWNNIMSVVNTVGKAFGDAFGVVSGIVKGAFNGIVGVIKGAINSVIDLVNGAIGAINDTVGAAGAAFGVNIKIGKIPRLAQGALINPTPGGTLATIGEGKYPEAVVPMSPKILDQLGGGNGRGETVTNWTINEVTDTVGTALAIARRQNALGA